MYYSDYFKEYIQLMDDNRQYDLNDTSRQLHHIVPKSLGGSNTLDNFVALLPKDHVKAHELLFKHTMFCAVKKPVNKFKIK